MSENIQRKLYELGNKVNDTIEEDDNTIHLSNWIKLINENKLNINEQTINFNSPSVIAIFKHNLPALKLMLKAGIDINSINLSYGNYTLLTTAVYANNYEALSLLLEKGVDLMIKNKEDRTALEEALLRALKLDEDHTDLAIKLLDYSKPSDYNKEDQENIKDVLAKILKKKKHPDLVKYNWLLNRFNNTLMGKGR